MKLIKKILKGTLVGLLVLIVLLVASTFIFKGKIIALVKSEINKSLTAKVDFKKIDISFFRHFPKVSIGLDELQVVGTGYFTLDTLLTAERLDATVNFMSFVRGKDMSIYSLYLKKPVINAIVSTAGFANWDIIKKDSHTTNTPNESHPFKLTLEKYAIENATIHYNDFESGMSADIENLMHSGSGDFNADHFLLKTTTTADAVDFVYGNVPFLSKVKTSINTNINVDNTKDQYSLDALDMVLNELKIKGKGSFQVLPKGYGMDFSFQAPSTDFKQLLSLIPVVYHSDFEKLQAGGNASFDGFVKGVYADSVLPAYHLNLTVKDGSFKYADLPKSIQQINFKALVDNPDGQSDHTVVDISNGHLQVDREPFDFRVLVKNPISNMYVDAAAKGKLNLNQVTGFMKLDEGTVITGLMNADVNVKGNVKDIEAQQFGKFYAGGTIDLGDFSYRSNEYPTAVKINTLHTNFTSSQIDLSDLNGQYMGTNFSGGGEINNLFSYLLNGKSLQAKLGIAADKINLNDWMGIPAETATSNPSAASAPFIVPANLQLGVDTRIGSLKYDNLTIQDLTGNLQVSNETIKINDVNGNALDGKIKINGSYSTKESKTNPAISMSYEVQQVDIQKTFYAFNTAQKLMPIGKYLSGKLTSVLNANGRLGENMNVDLSTISGKGNLLLIEGFLSKFAPLDKIASTLNVKELEQLSLKDVKTYFEFSNGKLLVKPFTVKVKNIEMEIGGLQGFDETMDYAINLALPRSLIGLQGNQLLNNLVGNLNAKGVPVKLGDNVNLKLALGGTIRNPTVKVDLKQTGETLTQQIQQQVKDFAQAKIDSAKAIVKDTLQSIKNQLGAAAKEELRKKLFGKDTTSVADTTIPNNPTQKTKESVKGLLDNILKKKPKDTTTRTP